MTMPIDDQALDAAIAGMLARRAADLAHAARPGMAQAMVAGARRPRPRTHSGRLVLVMALLACLATATTLVLPSASPRPPIARTPVFRALGDMTTRRAQPTAVRLEDGDVLIVAGGTGRPEGPLGSTPKDPGAEVWEMATETFVRTPDDAFGPNVGAAGVLLPDGRVFISGGLDHVWHQSADGYGYDGRPNLQALVWDPATRTARSAGVPGVAMFPRRAWLMPDGRVGLAGELIQDEGSPRYGAEAWDPATETFSPLPDPLPDEVAPGVDLPDGRRLLAPRWRCWRACDIQVWDPSTGSRTTVGRWEEPRSEGATFTVLADGRVLAAGGRARDGGMCGATAEIWDPVTGAVESIGDMTSARANHTSVLLDDGRVLILGGASSLLSSLSCPSAVTAEILEWQ